MRDDFEMIKIRVKEMIQRKSDLDEAITKFGKNMDKKDIANVRNIHGLFESRDHVRRNLKKLDEVLSKYEQSFPGVRETREVISDNY